MGREAPSQSQCNNHPCGWIKYHNSNWNSYSAYDVIENTFCPCPALSRCRYSDTNTALDLQVHLPGGGEQQQDLPHQGEQQEEEERHRVSQEEGEPSEITKDGSLVL